MELGKYGITVNGYAPGAIDTQLRMYTKYSDIIFTWRLTFLFDQVADSIVYYTQNAGVQQGTIDAEVSPLNILDLQALTLVLATSLRTRQLLAESASQKI